MSWIDQIQEDLIITTGDGKEYRPDWMNAERQKDFNSSEFNFSEVQGSLVVRKEPKGTRYGLELHFQGEDCIDLGNAFWESANDSRAWTISHPFYGTITVQPVSLKQDNTKYNDSVFTGSVVETIGEEYPKAETSPADKILSDQEAVTDLAVASFDVTPEAADVATMTANNDQLYEQAASSISDESQAEGYFNLYIEANTAVINATAKPSAAMRAIQTFITYPFVFKDSVVNRVNLLVNQFTTLTTSVVNLTRLNDKKIYESTASGIISAIGAASVTPEEGDYKTRNDVIAIQEILLDTLNDHVNNLDALQSESGAEEESFMPNTELYAELHGLITFAVSNLNQIVSDSKQERIIILEEDSNPVVLAHRFYGMDATDEALDYFIDTNEIAMDELFDIRKGTSVKYYV